MDILCAAPLALALLSGWFARRTRAVWAFGRFGDALAPAFLLILWFCFLHIGEWTGSLRGMAWIAATPVVAVAAFAFPTRLRRRSSTRWSWVDWYLFIVVALLLLLFNGEDNACHYSLISTYLRGNIPPCALNDPAAPLAYHSMFDAAAALVARALGVGHRSAIALVSVACFYATFQALQALSRSVLETERTRQIGRALFLFGFGPIYLRLLERGPHPGKPDYFLNGDTAMPFIESILRRPIGIGWLILIFALAAASTLRRGRWNQALLLPCAYLIPQSSEELLLLATAAVLFVWIRRGGDWRLPAAWLAVLAASWSTSGLGRELLWPHASIAAPHPAPAWPWTLPSRALLLRADGLPLFSWNALQSIAVEWGPLFLAGLYFCWKNPKRRPLVLLFAIGFTVAVACKLVGWVKSDLDRFLFYGTALVFMGGAELLARWPRPWAAAALTLTVAGPAGYALRSMAINDADSYLSSDAILSLQAALSQVGPKEQIWTDDPRLAQQLVLAGFVVAAPMKSQWIGRVDGERLEEYQKNLTARPDWVYLPDSEGTYRLRRTGRFPLEPRFDFSRDAEPPAQRRRK